MCQCVVVFDCCVLSAMARQSVLDLRKFLESKSVYSIMWTSNDTGSRMNSKALLSFDFEIAGHVNGMKNIKHIRSIFKTNPAILSKPVLLIDKHSKSLEFGCFDCSINIEKYKFKDFNDVCYDFNSIYEEIMAFLHHWHGLKLNNPLSETSWIA